jgi:hypothetical protein
LGQVQKDVRRIETTPYYLRSSWRRNRFEQIDQSLCAIPKGSTSIRFRAETAKILEEKYNEHINIYTDGSKKDEKVGCAVITRDQKFRKRLKPQKRSTVLNKKQSSKRYTLPKGQVNGMIITDYLSTLMVVEGDIYSKSPKTLSLRNYWTKKERKSPF